MGGTELKASEATKVSDPQSEVSSGSWESGSWSVGERERLDLVGPMDWRVSALMGEEMDASFSVLFASGLFEAAARMRAFIAAGTGPVHIRAVTFRSSDNLRVVRMGPLVRAIVGKDSGVGLIDVLEGGAGSAAT